MPHLSAFKFLSSSAAAAAAAVRLPSLIAHTPRRSLTLLSACGRARAVGGGGVLSQSRSARKRRRSSGGGAGVEMEEREGMGFNRKRAEGSDGGKKRNLQLKVRKLNPVNTICYVQILGTGMDTQDTSPSVLLFFDRQRILFNAGEGLQRFCTEHKIKLSKIDHILLTRVCSETAGGIPGLLLTLANIGEEGMSVNVWGPSDLKYLIDAMRSFIPNAAMVHSHSFGETSNGDSAVLSGPASKFIDPIVIVNDEVVKISAILLHSRQPKKSNGGVNHSQVLEFCGESSAKPGDVAVIYVCELPEISGKFDPSKAKSLGLKPGPKYRELQLGNSVMSDSQGIMVHPSDVLGPSIPGPIVLLVDCPTTYHLAELVTLQSLSCYYTNSTGPQDRCGAKSVSCVIHLGPSSVTKNVEYQNWMRRFDGAQHIMAGYEMGNTAFPVLASSAKVTTRLNYVCPHLFPSPVNRQINNSHLDFNSSSEVSSSVNNVTAENLLKFYLRPLAQLGLDRSMIPSVQTTAEIVNELLSEIPEVECACKDVSDLWCGKRKVKNGGVSPLDEGTVMTEEPWMGDNDASMVNTECDPKVPSCLENITREDMEIVLLGTGSSQPSKYRNVSSIYVNLFLKGSILLDCGEGTLGQLKRRFGVEGADDAVKALRLIWISHIHADHHTGLARILALRCQLLRDQPHEPLLVVGPRPLKRFLDAYSQLEDLDLQFLDCRNTTEVSWNAIAESLGTDNNCSTEHAADVAGVDSVVTGTKSEELGASRQNLRNTIFATCSQMRSVWKHPVSPVDTQVTLPMLRALKKVLTDGGLDGLYSVPVVHCPQAFGVVIQAAKRMNSVGKVIPGWKLVYSGDTRPCQALVDASRGATVLIHEATFEDGMEDEALARNHSTTMEAVNVGTTADAYRIILTHFSQRYPKIPVFDETHMSKTCIGFDMMSINAADLHVLPKVLPHLKLLFKNEMAPDESDDVAAVATTQ